jgi:hypothetical protein
MIDGTIRGWRWRRKFSGRRSTLIVSTSIRQEPRLSAPPIAAPTGFVFGISEETGERAIDDDASAAAGQ